MVDVVTHGTENAGENMSNDDDDTLSERIKNERLFSHEAKSRLSNKAQR